MSLPLLRVPVGQTEPVSGENSTGRSTCFSEVGSILVSVQQAEVPLLEGDAVDHHQVVQVVLSCGCSSWDPPRLQEGERQTLDTGSGHMIR